MISVDLFWIILISSYTLIFLTFFIVTFVKTKINKELNFLQFFPFEFLNDRQRITPLLKVLQYAYVIPCVLPIVLIFLNYNYFSELTYFEAILGSLMLLISLLNITISYIPPKNTRPHIIISVIHISVSFLFSALVAFNGFYIFFLYRKIAEFSVNHLVAGIIGVIFTILMILIEFNPKLVGWYKLNTIEENDGTSKLERPKIFPLAFSEWASIIISFLSGLLFLVELIKI